MGWSRQTLALFAVHHETGKPIPDAMFTAMTCSCGFGRDMHTQRQLFLAALDQAYHTKTPPFDTTKVLQETNDAYTPFEYVEARTSRRRSGTSSATTPGTLLE